jgi:hypothetical protein
MKITNNQELLGEIQKILNSVKVKADAIGNPQASGFLALYIRLLKIEKNVKDGNYSIEAKQECDMNAPIAYLYEEANELPLLGQVLCDVNKYYQEAGIKKFNLDEAKMYFMYRG